MGRSTVLEMGIVKSIVSEGREMREDGLSGVGWVCLDVQTT